MNHSLKKKNNYGPKEREGNKENGGEAIHKKLWWGRERGVEKRKDEKNKKKEKKEKERKRKNLPPLTSSTLPPLFPHLSLPFTTPFPFPPRSPTSPSPPSPPKRNRKRKKTFHNSKPLFQQTLPFPLLFFLPPNASASPLLQPPSLSSPNPSLPSPTPLPPSQKRPRDQMMILCFN